MDATVTSEVTAFRGKRQKVSLRDPIEKDAVNPGRVIFMTFDL